MHIFHDNIDVDVANNNFAWSFTAAKPSTRFDVATAEALERRVGD